MRFVLAALLWLLTTIGLAVAVPAGWVQQNVVDADGYAAFAQRAAADPALQRAVAGELTRQITQLAATDVTPAVVGLVASGFTASSAFPGQFAQANRLAHRWMFTNSVQSEVDTQGRWVVDLAPLLADGSFQQTLAASGVAAAGAREALPQLWWWTQGAILGCGVGTLVLMSWSYRLEPNPFALLLRRLVGSATIALLLLSAATVAIGRQDAIAPIDIASGSIPWYLFMASMALLLPVFALFFPPTTTTTSTVDCSPAPARWPRRCRCC